MFVSCVHPVAVLNAAFCMTCRLLRLVEDARGDHMEEAYSRTGLITALYVAMSVSFCLPHPVAVSAFFICRDLWACTEMLWMCVLYVSFGSNFLISVFMFTVSKALLISSATVIVRAGGAIWLNPFVTVLFSVCSAVTVECYVLYPCCMGMFAMFAVM